VDKKVSRSYTWIYWIVFILAVSLTAVGVRRVITTGQWVMLAAGCASVVAVLITWPLALQLHAFHQASNDRAERALASINERFEQFSVMLNLISEQQLLSDRAKSVAFREKDSDALRRAIQDEMLKQNWEPALVLTNEMEKQFGFKQEADRLRAQIADKHNDVIRRQLSESMATIDRYVRAEAWPDALKEAQRVGAALPDSPMAQSMVQEVEKRREGQKQQLIQSLKDAAARHDADGGMEILKRLDTYLSPTEAEQYQEIARNILKERLVILRTQFAVSVQDHNWNEALRLADLVTRDFPNTQMAKEVREMMDSLRARAEGREPVAAQAS
jgi:hypothetical protein